VVANRELRLMSESSRTSTPWGANFRRFSQGSGTTLTRIGPGRKDITHHGGSALAVPLGRPLVRMAVHSGFASQAIVPPDRAPGIDLGGDRLCGMVVICVFVVDL